MKEYKSKILIFIPIIIFVIAELYILYDIIAATYVYMFNFLFIILIIAFANLNMKTRNMLQGFILLILLRIINISMPKLFSIVLLQYSLIYGMMYIPIYYVIKDYRIQDLNMTLNNIIIYIPIAILIGGIIAIVEYRIINPAALIDRLTFSNILLIIIIMFMFIGAVEEILFRLILQTRLQMIIGLRNGILVSGIIFGLMHAEYGQINEILFSSVVGIVIGYIFYRARSLPFTITIHGTTNVILFGILPFLKY